MNGFSWGLASFGHSEAKQKQWITTLSFSYKEDRGLDALKHRMRPGISLTKQRAISTYIYFEMEGENPCKDHQNTCLPWKAVEIVPWGNIMKLKMKTVESVAEGMGEPD